MLYSLGLGHTKLYLEDEVSRLLQVAVKVNFEIQYDPLPQFTLPARAISSQPQAEGTGESVSARDCPDDSAAGSHITSRQRDKTAVAWVGEESTTLTKLLMTCSGTPVRLILFTVCRRRLTDCYRSFRTLQQRKVFKLNPMSQTSYLCDAIPFCKRLEMRTYSEFSLER